MADELELASLTLYQILVIWSSYAFYVGIHTLGIPYPPAWLPAISAYHADAAIALVALGRGFLPEYPPAWIPTHPLRALGAAALGSSLTEVVSCKYHGLAVL